MDSSKYVSTNMQSLCDKGQDFLVLWLFHVSKDDSQCQDLVQSVKEKINNYEDVPIIYLITPTYARPVQKAELTRMSHTLLLVPYVHWIVVEDSENKTSLVTNFLAKSRIPYTHLNVPSPFRARKSKKGRTTIKSKGVPQRNLALAWIRNNVDPTTMGVVYFADDDNTYDLQLFEEMRYTEKVSVWPVGFAGGLLIEKANAKNGKVIGWNARWGRQRPFPIDMAGFAVNLTLLFQHPQAGFNFSAPSGYQETTFLEYLVTVDELEPKADNCSTVLVWHTQTQRPNVDNENSSFPSNWNIEV